MNKRLILTFYLVTTCLQLSISQNNIKSDIDLYFHSFKDGVNINNKLNEIINTDATELFYAINSYFTDTIVENRMESLRIIGIVGLKSINQEIRKRIVKQLVNFCKDNDAGIVGMSFGFLKDFSTFDFDSEAKYELTNYLNLKIPYYHELVKLIGFIGIQETIPEFQKIIREKKYPNNKSRWAIHIALARMGDTTEINFCLNKIKNAPLGDNLIYELFPDITYIRQKQTFDYLLSIIESDKKNCLSPNPDSEAKIICAYKVIQLVAPYIENFPLKPNLNGDLIWGNPDLALVKVREWIKQYQKNYNLIIDKY